MPLGFRRRFLAHQKARRVVGQQRQGAAEKYIFMQQCVPAMVDEGEAGDEDEARDICELLWAEGEDYW